MRFLAAMLASLCDGMVQHDLIVGFGLAAEEFFDISDGCVESAYDDCHLSPEGDMKLRTQLPGCTTKREGVKDCKKCMQKKKSRSTATQEACMIIMYLLGLKGDKSILYRIYAAGTLSAFAKESCHVVPTS